MIDLTLTPAKAQDTPRGQTSLGSRETSANPVAADRSPFSLSIGLSPPIKASQPAEPTEDAAPEDDAAAAADGPETPAPPVDRHPLWPNAGGSASVVPGDQAGKETGTAASDVTVPQVTATRDAGVAARTTVSPSLASDQNVPPPSPGHDPLSRDPGLAVRATAARDPYAESLTAAAPGQTATLKAGTPTATTGPQETPAAPVGSDLAARSQKPGSGAVSLIMDNLPPDARERIQETPRQPDPGQRAEIHRQAEVLRLTATPRLTEVHSQPEALRLAKLYRQPGTHHQADPYRPPDPRIPVLPGTLTTGMTPAPHPMLAAYAPPDMTTQRERQAHAPDAALTGTALTGPLTGPITGSAGTTIMATAPGSLNAGAVTAQIAAALSQTTLPGVIELKLSPAELGPVRIAMQASDGVMLVTINAENPQTLDLMRRNSDLLLQEFRNLGHGSVAFQFSSGNDQGRGARDNPPAQGDFDPAIARPTDIAPRIKADGLDLRL